ncbi:hypothetical protein HKD37_16G045228 [Glycine soja]
MSQNFTDSMTMGFKHFEVVKRRSHADKQWSPDEIRECLEGVWETLEGNERCRFRGTIRLTATSLVHPEEPARTLQQPVEWILPTPTPYRLVEPVQVIEVSSSEEDPEEDPEELPLEPAVDDLDLPEDDEDPFSDVDSPEDMMSASEADSIEESGPRGTANSEDSSS